LILLRPPSAGPVPHEDARKEVVHAS
jgi:hypothetical protein